MDGPLTHYKSLNLSGKLAAGVTECRDRLAVQFPGNKVTESMAMRYLLEHGLIAVGIWQGKEEGDEA